MDFGEVVSLLEICRGPNFDWSNCSFNGRDNRKPCILA